MLKIGILGNFENNICHLEKVLNKTQKNILLIKLDENILKKNYSFSFDILIFNIFPNYLMDIILNKDCLVILNNDIKINNANIFKNNNILTFGLKNNSVSTISSLKNNSLQFCLQKNLKSISNNIIYQQEFKINFEMEDIYSILSSILIALILDLSPEDLKNIFFNSSSKIKSL